jgi:hypothetical protein
MSVVLDAAVELAELILIYWKQSDSALKQNYHVIMVRTAASLTVVIDILPGRL